MVPHLYPSLRRRLPRQGPYDRYLVIILGHDAYYPYMVGIRPGERTVTAVKHNGRLYPIDAERAFLIRDWEPQPSPGYFRRHVLGEFQDWLARYLHPTGVIFHLEDAGPPGSDLRQPLVRWEDWERTRTADELSPGMLTAMTDNSLYRKYQRSTKFGTGVSVSFVLVLMGVVGALFIILWFAGYFNA